jgi:O-antigen/teichoic acid export membrane protein
LSKNQIRVQYSGFIIFSSQILSIATGLIFTLLLTRNMNTSQYGIWTNIFDYTAYFWLFSGLLPFWATRFMARGKEGTVKTSTTAQLVIALISTTVYLPAIVLISNAIGTQAYLPIYLIAGVYIFDFYMVAIFESVLRSKRPQVIGYGLLIEELVKVSIALVFIMGLGQLFLGAISALVVSALVQVFYYVWVLRDEFKQKIDWGYVKEWFKGSVAIAYSSIGGQLVSFVMVLLFYYGGSNSRAFYQAAFTFTNVIAFSSSLAFALYPKLLAKSCPDEQVGVSFRTVMMLAIPLSTITMVMATSFLTILDIDYAVAWPVVIALTVDTLVVLVSQFYGNCVMGAEAFDAEGKIHLRQLVRSKIFKVFTVTYIQASIALPLTYFVLTALPVAGSVQATVDVIVISIGVHLSTFAGVYFFMRKSIRLPVSWRSIAKYVSASALMGALLFLAPATSTLLFTVAKATAGLAIYIALLLAIDKQARELFKLIIWEIKGTLNQLTSKNKGSQGKNSVLTSEN